MMCAIDGLLLAVGHRVLSRAWSSSTIPWWKKLLAGVARLNTTSSCVLAARARTPGTAALAERIANAWQSSAPGNQGNPGVCQ